MLLVDKVLLLEKDVRIQAVKNVTFNEPYFNGHFPRRPVMPGVMILEAMAQSAALLSFASFTEELTDNTVVYFAGIDNARFKRPVEPGDQLILEASIERVKGGIYKYQAFATVDGVQAASATLMCTMRTVG
jgi:3-hydroxyacyl-[acyl-carrier-protein] dehydratase